MGASFSFALVLNLKIDGLISLYRRVTRAVTPEAVACRLSDWSEWTDCFPCQNKKVSHLGAPQMGVAHLIFALGINGTINVGLLGETRSEYRCLETLGT